MLNPQAPGWEICSKKDDVCYGLGLATIQSCSSTLGAPLDVNEKMPTKADRKHLDATVAAFHSHYAAPANWGHERWHASLYPALAKPTRYAALQNQYVTTARFEHVLASVAAEELQPLPLPRLPSDTAEEGTENTARPRIILYERISPGVSRPDGEARQADDDEAPKAHQDDGAFLFPAPQLVPSPSNPDGELMSHWNMDAASALSAHMLDVQPNNRVLDLCAAPGGKSVALAQLIFPHLHAASSSSSSFSASAPAASTPPKTITGCLHANEVDHFRNKRLASNLRSYLPASLFEANAVRILRLDGADASSVAKLPLGPGGYDRVLLDAPCSSERHIIHAHVKAAAGGRIADEMARWRRGGSKTLAKLQTDLLMTALRAVKVGGKVVYSTCSIEMGENDGVIEKMLAAMEKEKKKFGLTWKVKFELGSLAKSKTEAADDAVMERLTEETKYGRIAVPDHNGGGQWGPLFFCVISKVARKVS